jgi:hypothetical protein
VLAERLGDALWLCDSVGRFTAAPLLWLVADGDCSRPRLRRAGARDWFGNVDVRQVPVVEVVGCAAYEAVSRLLARGVLARGRRDAYALLPRRRLGAAPVRAGKR